jgi:hypothetical protein
MDIRVAVSKFLTKSKIYSKIRTSPNINESIGENFCNSKYFDLVSPFLNNSKPLFLKLYSDKSPVGTWSKTKR